MLFVAIGGAEIRSPRLLPGNVQPRWQAVYRQNSSQLHVHCVRDCKQYATGVRIFCCLGNCIQNCLVLKQKYYSHRSNATAARFGAVRLIHVLVLNACGPRPPSGKMMRQHYSSARVRVRFCRLAVRLVVPFPTLRARAPARV